MLSGQKHLQQYEKNIVCEGTLKFPIIDDYKSKYAFLSSHHKMTTLKKIPQNTLRFPPINNYKSQYMVLISLKITTLLTTP